MMIKLVIIMIMLHLLHLFLCLQHMYKFIILGLYYNNTKIMYRGVLLIKLNQ